MLRSIVAFCQRYDHLERAAAAANAMAAGHPGLLGVQDKAMMAPGDAVLLVAYLDLLTCVDCTYLEFQSAGVQV